MNLSGLEPATSCQGANKPKRTWRRLGFGSRSGVTLVEVMVGGMIFTMVMLGVYGGLVEAYRLEALCRYRDNARAVLRSYVDQFQRLQTVEKIDGVSWGRWLFRPTGGASGEGLVLLESGALCDANEFTVLHPESAPLEITLGTGSYSLPARVTKEINYINPSSGDVSSTMNLEAAGYLIRGIFRIEFTYNGKSYTESLSVLRTVK